MHDLIVVGGRVAGSVLAMGAARSGLDVLLLDRVVMPQDTCCTHVLRPQAVAFLRAWGLEEEILAHGCPKVRRFDLVLGGHRARSMAASYRKDVRYTIAPRRRHLDAALRSAAMRAGATVREGVSVVGLLRSGGRVEGIVDQAGRTERARLVVGADGAASFLAREVHPQVLEHRKLGGIAAHSYWEGLESHGATLAFDGAGRTVSLFPTDGGLVGLTVGSRTESARGGKDLEDFVLRTVTSLVPSLRRPLECGRRRGRFLVGRKLAAWVRRPVGPGWALVGDAGLRQSPESGHGITDAMRDGHLLASALHAALVTRDRSLEEALAAFELARNRHAIPLFEAVHGRVENEELREFSGHGSSLLELSLLEDRSPLPSLEG